MLRGEVKEVLGEVMARREINAATIHRLTGVSEAMVRNMARDGYVASRNFVIRLTDGLGEPRVPLLVASGYTPSDEDLEHDRHAFPHLYDEGQVVPPHLMPFTRLGDISAIPHLPVYGKVPCGEPECETQEEAVDLPVRLNADFILQARGDSMEPHYHDGDLLVIRLTKEPEVGKNVVGIVEGEIFCKKFAGTVEKDGITFYRLEPTNHKFKEIDAREVDFQGQVVYKVIPS